MLSTESESHNEVRTSAETPMSLEQRELLAFCLRLYLNHLWTTVAPSAERNKVIRVLQAVKSKLQPLLELPSAPIPLLFTLEEIAVLQEMLAILIQVSGKLPEFTLPEQKRKLILLKEQIDQTGSI